MSLNTLGWTLFCLLRHARLLAVLGISLAAASPVHAVFTVGSFNARAEWPEYPSLPGPSVVTAALPTALESGVTGGRAINQGRVMAQTFQVSEPIALESIFLGYQWIQQNAQGVFFRLLEVPSRGHLYSYPNPDPEVKVIVDDFFVNFGAEPNPDPENNPDKLYALRLNWSGDPLVLIPRQHIPGATGSEAYAIEFRGTSPNASATVGTIRHLTTQYPNGVYLEQTPAGDNNSFGGNSEHTVAIVGTPVDLGLQGDFNDDGVVNSLDYVMWRMGGELHNDWTPGWQEMDYLSFQANYGNTSEEGSGTSGAVPEPASLAMLGVMLLASLLNRRRR